MSEKQTVPMMVHRNIRGNGMSKGTYRVGLDFNPSGSGTVAQIKELAASLIDMIEDIPPADQPHHAHNSEVARLKALAQTHVEDAAMWAVKAATKKPQEDELALAKSMDDPNWQALVEEPKEE